MVNDNSVTLVEWFSYWMFPAKTEYRSQNWYELKNPALNEKLAGKKNRTLNNNCCNNWNWDCGLRKCWDCLCSTTNNTNLIPPRMNEMFIAKPEE